VWHFGLMMPFEMHKQHRSVHSILDLVSGQVKAHVVTALLTCPLTKFDGGLNLLHEANGDAVIWLESTATAALAK